MDALQLKPILKPKVWGGARLTEWIAADDASREPIGEAWIAAGECVVANAPHADTTLNALVASHPADLLGRHAAVLPPRFPLLVKLLDARQNLSVQVHPDDSFAQQVEHQPFGKAEVWYILDAEPGAVIYRGTQRAVTSGELAHALEEGRVDDVLHRVDVRPGDIILNAPGTIHALGGGIVLYELQQASDITYRLYDWDRAGEGAQRRELHIDKGTQVSILSPLPSAKIEPIPLATGDGEVDVLCACSYFAAQRVRMTPGNRRSIRIDGFDIITVLEGHLRLTAEGWSEPAACDRTRSVVVPAGTGEYHVEALGADATFIRAWVPDLARDIVQPLRDAGHSTQEIAQLGVGDGGFTEGQ